MNLGGKEKRRKSGDVSCADYYLEAEKEVGEEAKEDTVIDMISRCRESVQKTIFGSLLGTLSLREARMERNARSEWPRDYSRADRGLVIGGQELDVQAIKNGVFASIR